MVQTIGNNDVRLKPNTDFLSYSVWQLPFQWKDLALWQYFCGLDIPFKNYSPEGPFFFLKHVYLLTLEVKWKWIKGLKSKKEQRNSVKNPGFL